VGGEVPVQVGHGDGHDLAVEAEVVDDLVAPLADLVPPELVDLGVGGSSPALNSPKETQRGYSMADPGSSSFGNLRRSHLFYLVFCPGWGCLPGAPDGWNAPCLGGGGANGYGRCGTRRSCLQTELCF